MENYPSNSHKTKAPVEDTPEPKKIEAVVTGDVVRRKKPLGKRLVETFIGGDANSVFNYVVMDVLVPAAKDTISDAFSQGIERMLFGDVRSPSRRANRGGTTGTNGYVSYNRMSQPSTRPSRNGLEEFRGSRRSSHDFDDIILATRVEAEEVIDRLFDLVSQYEQVTVADLLELVGQTGSYTDQKWGWTDIRGAGVTKIRGGYLLDIPKPEALT